MRCSVSSQACSRRHRDGLSQSPAVGCRSRETGGTSEPVGDEADESHSLESRHRPGARGAASGLRAIVDTRQSCSVRAGVREGPEPRSEIPFCVRTVSHTPVKPCQTASFTRRRCGTSLLREVVDRNCVGGIWCASARAKGSNFQACLIDRSSISPSLESYTCGRRFETL